MIYAQMGLINQNYHNHAHNLCATYAMLLLVKDLARFLSLKMKKGAFVAALLHDFHIRARVFQGRQSAPLVEETISQISDLFGIPDRLYQKGATSNTRYSDPAYRVCIDRAKQALRGLAGHDNESLFKFVVAMIRRTDFPSDIAPASPKIKYIASEIRSKLIDSPLNVLEAEDTVSEIQLLNIAFRVERAFNRNVFDKIVLDCRDGDSNSISRNRKDRIWALRRKSIEIAYIYSLIDINRIDPSAVSLVHKMACLFEKGADQSSYYWLSSPELIKASIITGLDRESPFPVTKAGSYPFFFKNELLTPDVIKFLSILPMPYKKNFLRVMRHFSVESRKAGEKMRWSEEPLVTKKALLASEKHWLKWESAVATVFGFERGAKGLVSPKKSLKASKRNISHYLNGILARTTVPSGSSSSTSNSPPSSSIRSRMICNPSCVPCCDSAASP